MHRGSWVLRFGLLVACVAGAACFSRPGGWFRADKAPPAEDEYDARFEPLTLSADAGCEPVLARQGAATAPIIVLVPGIGGDGEEMRQALPVLMTMHPASVFMFRYGAFEPRDALADRLAAGLSRLVECMPDGAGRLLVLAHSAGGVLSSHAASKVTPPASYSGDWLTVLTVASPLAGTSRVPPGRTPPPNRPMMLELGVKIDSYPASVAGVRFVHLRTSAASDGFMRPSGDHLPNDPSIGVPGAAQIDLPVELDHPQSLVYVAKRIADGTWKEWLAVKPSAAKAP